jgi:prepilin-type N-terminal cleavage/methylation domain-containing protein
MDRTMCAQDYNRRGVSLVEVLIVVAIIAILLQVALPAIESSREAARRTQCANNLRQLALAFQTHHGAHGQYPSSGWGWQWVGHPDRGYGPDQPGGWAYNILSFIEQLAIRELGSKLPDESSELQNAILLANATPISLFNCPSRRLPRTYPLIAVPHKELGFSPLLPSECREVGGEPCQVARSDYAVNSGNIDPGTEAGPNSLDEAKSWPWLYAVDGNKKQNGISHQRSQVEMAQVTDGLSKTYCVGEKYVPVAHYKTGKHWNDDLSLFVGHDGDMNRYTADPKHSEYAIGRDKDPVTNQQFGSAHPTVFHMSFCDGSVKPVSYEVDLETHRLLGGRDDGVGLDIVGP